MELAQKVKIEPTLEQEDVQWILSEKNRLVYNFFLADRIKAYEETGVDLTYQIQQDYLPELKKKYPEYGWVNSKVLQMTVHQLDDDMHSFKKKKKGGYETANHPGYKGRDYFATMIWNRSGFKIEDGYIILSHYYNEGKKNYVELKFEIPENLMNNTDIDLQTIYDFGKIKQIVMYREEPNRKKKSGYYLSVVYDYPVLPMKDNGLYQAIDLGIDKTVTAVNMEAKFFEINNPRKDLYWNPIIDSIQSRRDHCKKTEEKVKGTVEYIDEKYQKKEKDVVKKTTEVSNKWVRLDSTKKNCHKKLSNQIIDEQHKWSKMMVNNTKSNTIIVGKLNVKDMAQTGVKINVKDERGDTKTIKVKSHKLNRSTQNQGYLSRFVGFLTYKAEKIGKRVIEISEVNTTKRCYVCGKLHEMPLSQRTMVCDCGNKIDRDRNSAINIMINFLLKYNLHDGLRRFIGNLGKEGLLVPIWVKV